MKPSYRGDLFRVGQSNCYQMWREEPPASNCRHNEWAVIRWFCECKTLKYTLEGWQVEYPKDFYGPMINFNTLVPEGMLPHIYFRTFFNKKLRIKNELASW